MKILFSLGILCVLSASVACSQSTGIPWSALDGGFAISSSHGVALATAIGQPFIVTMQQANTRILSGFLAAPIVNGTVVNVPETGDLPKRFALQQNFPNPFNPTTTIRFEVPEKSFVSLHVFNVLGQEVAQLVNDEKNPGSYDVRFDATRLASGLYFYVLKAGSFTQTRKLLLLK